MCVCVCPSVQSNMTSYMFFSSHAMQSASRDEELNTTVCNRQCLQFSFLVCSFNSPSVQNLFPYTLIIKCLQRKVAGRKEFGRPVWPDDVNKTQNVAFGKHGCQTVHRFMCCVLW